jgi:hypothetical protein
MEDNAPSLKPPKPVREIERSMLARPTAVRPTHSEVSDSAAASRFHIAEPPDFTGGDAQGLLEKVYVPAGEEGEEQAEQMGVPEDVMFSKEIEALRRTDGYGGLPPQDKRTLEAILAQRQQRAMRG